MPAENFTEAAYPQFSKHWQNELQRAADSQGATPPSLLRALWRAHGRYYLVAGLFKLAWSAFVIAGAFYFVHSLLAHVQDDSQVSGGSLYSSTLAAWCLTAGFFIDCWLMGICLQRMGYMSMQTGVRVRACLVQAVAQKAFRRNCVRQEQAAHVINFVSSDIQKIFDGVMEFHYLWTAPLEASAILALLAYMTSDAMLPGLGLIILIVPLQYYFGYKIVKIKSEHAKHSKERAGILQEVLPAIKLVKYYAWEKHFEDEIDKVRRKELKLSFWMAVLKIINVSAVFAVPPLTAFVIFTTYEYTTSRLASSVAFTTLSLFNILRFPLVVLPKALRAVPEAYSSLSRLEEYLLEDPSPALDQPKTATLEPAPQVQAEAAAAAVRPAVQGGLCSSSSSAGANADAEAAGVAVALKGAAHEAGSASTTPASVSKCVTADSDSDKEGPPSEGRVDGLMISSGPLVKVDAAGDGSQADVASGVQDQGCSGALVPGPDAPTPPGVHMEGAVFTYHGDTNRRFVLSVPKFEVRPGQVVAVVGRIGAGKSTLVRAILGRLNREAGASQVGGRVAYVPQNPWLQNVSLKENVLFGEPFDTDRYESTIDACCLGTDLRVLPQGDRSKAGIRGVNFSGGQRQRISVARAAYCAPELVLMDNSLSSVDYHTAHHMFERCIKGVFAKSAVVLVTHNIEFLPKCDAVAVMDEGRCLYFGKWCKNAEDLLGRLLPVSHMLRVAVAAELAACKMKPRQPEAASKRTTILAQAGSANMKDKTQLTTGKAGERPNSRLSARRAVWVYVMHANVLLTVACLFLFVVAQATRQISDFWVRWWVADEHGFFDKSDTTENEEHATKFYSLMYLMLVILFWIAMLLRGATFFWATLQSAERLRRKALHRVLNAPMGFFLMIPVGDLLLNFSEDQDIMDENLPDAMHFCGIYGLILIATTTTVTVNITFFGAFDVVLIGATAIMLYFYLPAAKVLKAWRAETGGALVGHVAETLEGLNVIQAFRKQDYFIAEAARRVDLANRAMWKSESLNLWLAFWCDLLGALLVLVVCIFAITLKDKLGPAVVGLALSNIIQLLVFYTWLVRFVTESISLFSSVESIAFLATEVPHDGVFYDPHAEHGVAQKITAPDGAIIPVCDMLKIVVHDDELTRWPVSGHVRFEAVWMQYRLDTPWALKNVSFDIRNGEKVGVVGRTGSGKSTLLQALFRMFELAKGRVLVDGVDISTITMHRLRRGLSIIPQEPVIFSGTIRSNLDPFGEYTSDDTLWDVLRRSSLEAQVQAMGGLDGMVGPRTMSVGQRQLMCLARAALRSVPILCLDEATALMDPHTEAMVTEIVSDMFEHQTVISIAHRLDTVIEFDKVMVMEAGAVKESGPPYHLLTARGSLFGKLVDRTGPTAAAALRRLAEDHFNARTLQGW